MRIGYDGPASVAQLNDPTATWPKLRGLASDLSVLGPGEGMADALGV